MENEIKSLSPPTVSSSLAGRGRLCWSYPSLSLSVASCSRYYNRSRNNHHSGRHIPVTCLQFGIHGEGQWPSLKMAAALAPVHKHFYEKNLPPTSRGNAYHFPPYTLLRHCDFFFNHQNRADGMLFQIWAQASSSVWFPLIPP